MSLSWPDLQKIVTELKPRLLGARLQELHQCSSDEFILVFYLQEEYALYLNLRAGWTGACLTNRAFRKLTSPGPILLFAKKHLRNHRLQELRLLPGSRVLLMRFAGGTLVAELQHQRGNLLVLSPEGVVEKATWRESELQNHDYVADPEAEGAIAVAGKENLRPREGESANVLADAIYARKDAEILRGSQHKSLRVEYKRQLRKVEHLQHDMKDTEAAPTFQRFGMAIQTNIYRLDKDKRLDVPLRLEDTQGRLTIPLPEPMSAVQAMHHYFERAKKLERKRRIAAGRLHQEEAILAELQQRLSTAENHDAVQKPPAIGSLQPEVPASKSTRLPSGIIEKLSPDGLRLWIGRNAEANDRLLKLANSNDLWLHVRDFPGSHCIIVREGKKEIPQSTIDWAVQVALQHSKAKNRGHGDVEVALRRDVKKFRNAAPGQVIVQRGKTVHVKS